jgi:hypothetical protein
VLRSESRFTADRPRPSLSDSVTKRTTPIRSPESHMFLENEKATAKFLRGEEAPHDSASASVSPMIVVDATPKVENSPRATTLSKVGFSSLSSNSSIRCLLASARMCCYCARSAPRVSHSAAHTRARRPHLIALLTFKKGDSFVMIIPMQFRSSGDS